MSNWRPHWLFNAARCVLSTKLNYHLKLKVIHKKWLIFVHFTIKLAKICLKLTQYYKNVLILSIKTTSVHNISSCFFASRVLLTLYSKFFNYKNNTNNSCRRRKGSFEPTRLTFSTSDEQQEQQLQQEQQQQQQQQQQIPDLFDVTWHLLITLSRVKLPMRWEDSLR